MVKKLFRFLRSLQFRHTILVEITISEECLLHNLNTFKNNHPDMGIAPVLKSNAYGHGLTLVAKIVDTENIPFIIVDSYYEAMILRSEGIQSKILIIGYTSFNNILKQQLKNIAFTIVSLEQLQEIAENLNGIANFHLKIDTGMYRQGLAPEDLDKAISLIRYNPKIVVDGICSHLADADSRGSNFTKNQIKVWNDVVERCKKALPDIVFFHLSATSGTPYQPSTDAYPIGSSTDADAYPIGSSTDADAYPIGSSTDADAYPIGPKINANVLRLGVGLYGIDPSEDRRLPNLKPVLEMKSVISGTKKLNKGDRVGYGATFEAPNDMRIATIPAGYYEGIDRRLSNKGFVKIGGNFCPIVGRVSMNITTVDISNVPEVELNTPVVLISRNRADKNSIENIVKITGALERELLVHIPQGLRRMVVK